MSSYGCMLRPTWMISALWHKSKFNFELKKKKSKFNFELKKKTSQNSISIFFLIQIIMFPCSSTLEDLSIDVSNTNVGLILTKLRRFQLFVKIWISNFLEKKINNFGFPCCSTREDLSIDVSITNVGLILTKPRWFQLFVKSQNSNFELFWKNSNFLVSMLYYSWRPFHWCINYQCRADIDEAKVISALRQKSKFEFRTLLKKKKIQFLGFHGVVLEDFSIDVSNTNVGLILTKLRRFQLFVKIWISNFFEKKKSLILGFHAIVLVKTFPLMYQLLT